MLKRTWALIALGYLAFAEVSSWAPVPDLSQCLMQPEHTEQASNHGKKYCPAFHTGIVAALDALDGALDRHDKSVVGGFTIVLAISTIGLWIATVGLYKAGERQLDFLKEGFASQSRDMQASIAAGQQSAEAAKLNAESVIETERARLFVSIHDNNLRDMIAGIAKLDESDDVRTAELMIRYRFKNHGRTPAIIKEASHQLIHRDVFPDQPFYTPLLPLPISHILDGNDASGLLSVRIESAITVFDAKTIEAGDTSVWLYGYVSFDDTFGWGRELRFIFQYTGGLGDLRLYSYKEIQSRDRH